MTLGSRSVLAVAFRPDGVEIAGSLLNGNIVFFDSMSGDQLREIEGKHDLGLSKHEGELVTAKKASEEKLGLFCIFVEIWDI